MSEEQYRKTFVKKLHYYMELKGIKQTDLMKDLSLSSSTVSNWCTGQKLPRMGKIQLLADYFGIEKSDLIEEKEAEENRNQLEKEFLSLFEQLTVDEKNIIVDTIKSIISRKNSDC